MENKYQNTGTVSDDDGVATPPVSSLDMSTGQISSDPGALSSYDPTPSSQFYGDGIHPDNKPNILVRLVKRADVILAVLLVLSMIGVFVVTSSKKDENAPVTGNLSTPAKYETQSIPLGDFADNAEGLNIAASSVVVNGLAELNRGLVVTPSQQPGSPKAGQIYYDKDINQLAYYNGQDFIPVGTGVTSVQGRTGLVTLTAGNGIAINGTTISSTVSGGTGTVTSAGGTTGRIAKFTGVQAIGDSLLSESGTVVTVGGSLSVANALTLGAALSVANGGTGAVSLAANGVLIGNGTGAITSVTSGAPGECLLSTAGAPAFAACPGGGGGVSSLNGQSGIVNIANASGAAGTVTINDATTVSKGIASFSSTNFSVAAGAVNTIQNINSGATPTFAGVNTNSITPSAALTVGVSGQTALLQGSTTTITSSGAGNDIVLNSADTIELQDNTNVTGSLDVSGTLAAGTGNAFQVDTSGNVTAGNVAANGGNITSTGALNITPGGTLTAGVSSQTLTLQGNASTSLRATSGASTTIVGFVNPTANTTLNFPALSAGTYTICTTSGNCAGAGVTLQGAYDNSSTPEIVLDATRGALTIRDNAAPLGANLLEVQNNGGGTTYLAVTASGMTVTGTATVTGNINSSGGALQTNGTTRVDNSGNLSNIGSISLSGSISGGTTISGSGNFNSTGGAIQTNSTTRIDNSGNLTNIGSLTLSGAISGGTSFSGSGNINTTGGVIQTNSTTRVDNSGNLVNIAAITASGNATLQGGSVTLGTNTQAGSVVFNDGSSNTGTLQVAALGQNTVYTLPDPGGPAASICLTTGNCAGSGGGVTTGGGTTNRVSKFSGSQTIADSTITDDGTTVSTSVDFVIQGGDVTVGVANSQTGTINFAHSGSANLGSIVQGALTGNRTYTLPDSSGTFCLSSGNCLGGGGGGANTALSNLTGVAINTTLLPGAAGTINLGSGALPFGDIFLAGTSGTPGTNNFRITGASTSGTRTITLPDASGTVCLQSSAACGFATGSGAAFVQGGNSFTAAADLGTNDAFDLNLRRGGATKVTVGANDLAFASGIDLLLQGAGAYISNPQNGTDSEAFGLNASVDNGSQLNVSVGNGAHTSTRSIAVGANASADVESSVVLGSDAHTGASGSIAIGYNSETGSNQNSIAIGVDASTTAANQLVIGSSGSYINHAVLGNGVTNALPVDFTLQATSGSGADINGGDINIAAGQSTGNAFGGSINFQISAPGVAGGSLNGLTTVGTIGGAFGSVLFQNAVDSDVAFRIKDADGDNVMVVDTSASTIGLFLGGENTPTISNTGLQIQGGLQLSGTGGFHNWLTPDGASLGSALSIESRSVGDFSSLISLGLTSTSGANARGIIVADDRAVAHQPSIAVLSPDENNMLGFTWNGSSSVSVVGTNNKTSSGGNTAEVILQSGDVAGGAGDSGNVRVLSGSIAGGSANTTGTIYIASGNGGGTNASSGNVVIDSGSQTGSGTAGVLNIGIANASAITIGRSGLTTTNAGNLVIQGGTATFGTTSQQGILTLHDGNGQTAIISVGSALAGNTALAIPTAVGASDTFCLLTLANCVGTGGGIAGSGTTNRLTKFTASNSVGDASVVDNGSSLTLDSNVDIFLQGASAYISNPQGTTNSEIFGNGANTTGDRNVVVGNSATVASGNSDSVSIGYLATASDNSIAIGTQADCNNSTCTAIGYQAVSGFTSVALGSSASANNNAAVALGAGATTGAHNSIALGVDATTTALNQLVIGSSTVPITQAVIGNGVTNATPSGFTLQGTSGSGSNVAGAGVTIAAGQGTGSALGGSIVFQSSLAGVAGSSLNGLSTLATLSTTSLTMGTNLDILLQGATAYISNPQTQTNSEAFGLGATVAAGQALAVGSGAQALSDGAIAIGFNSSADGFGSPVVIGENASAVGGWGVAIGENAVAGSNWATALGNGAQAALGATALGAGAIADSGGIAIGQDAATNGNDRIVIGSGAQATANNQLILGGPSSAGFVDDIYLGSGVTDTAPVNVTVNATGGSGTDIQGASLTLAGGKGTGAGNGGAIVLQVATPSGSGGSLNSLTSVATLNGANGGLLLQNAINSASALEVQNAAGIQLLKLSSVANTANLVSNGSLEQNTTGWGVKGGASNSRITTQHYIGVASLQTTTTAAAGDGAKYNVTLSSSTQYTVSLYLRLASGTFNNNLSIGYSSDGVAETDCKTGETVKTGGWSIVNCTFTTGAVSGTPYFYWEQADATARTVYTDALQIVAGPDVGPYYEGKLDTGGLVFNGPVAIQNDTDSQTVFQVQDAQGQSIFGIDTVNKRIGINTLQPTATFHVASLSTTSVTAIFNQNASSTSDILRLQKGGTNVATVAHTGATTFMNNTDTATAFQIQDTGAAALINVNTLTRTGGVAGNMVKIGNSTGTDTATTILQLDGASADPTTNLASLNGGLFYNSSTDKVSIIENGAVKVLCNKTDLACGAGATTPLQTAYGDDVDGGDATISLTTADDSLVFTNPNNVNSTDSAFLLQLNQAHTTNAVKALDIIQASNAANAVNLTANSIDGETALAVSATALTTGFGIDITTGSTVTTGGGLRVTGSGATAYTAGNGLIQGINNGAFTGQLATLSSTGTTTGTLLNLTLSSASQTTARALSITQSGVTTGYTGNFVSFTGSSTTGTGNLLQLTSVNTTNGNALNVTSNSLTTGNAVNINSTGTGLTTGSLLRISSSTTGAVNTNGIVSLQASGNYTSTSNNGLLNVLANATTAGTITNIQGGALTSGVALNIAANTGTAIRVSSGLTTLTAPTSGSGDSFSVSNSTSTGNIAVFKDNATTVASIANGGAALFQNQTDGANGFRILTSGSGEVLGADTTNSIIRLLNNNNAAVATGGWTTNANNFAAGRWNHASVTYNGYVYVIGGRDNADVAHNDVYYAKLNANGSIGTWASTTALPVALGNLSAVTANGYVYALGGQDDTGTLRDEVYFAKLNTDGTVGTWNTTTVLPTELYEHSSVTANGYIYTIGGSNIGGEISTVYYARLNGDGSVGAWNTTSALANPRDKHASVVANGYVYALTGAVSGTASTDVSYAKLNVDGTLGSWASTTSLITAARYNATAAVMNGYLYHIGGEGPDYADVYYAPLNADGTIGSWTQTTDMNVSRRSATAVTANGYFYVIGGENGSATATQEYASPARVIVGGSLDLVGLSGETLAEGGSGGNLTAGNTQISGLLNVTGAATFRDSVTVNNNLTVQSQNNGTSAFTVVNGSAVPQFSVDSTNSRVYVGNPTADSTGALLVLDTKNTSGDPTGVLGAMYFNSNSGKMRCFETDQGAAGYWRDCVESARTAYRYNNEMMTTQADQVVLLYTSNAGTFANVTGVANHPGINELRTGTNTNGGAGVGSNDPGSAYLLGNGDYWRYEATVNVPTLSDGTNTFTARVGFSDNGVADAVDGCYFRYSSATNSGKWQGVCRNNNTESTCDTGITVAAGTWYRLTFTVNTAGNSVDFQTSGTSRCQVTTNIPTTAGRETSWNIAIQKSAGGTSRTLQVDYVELYAQFASSR